MWIMTSLFQRDPSERRSVVLLVAVALSLGLHGLLVAGPSYIHHAEAARARLVWFRVVHEPAVLKPTPPPAASPKPVIRTHRPVQRPRSVSRRAAAPPPPAVAAAPVFGASKESASPTGSGVFTVPLGNTVATDPDCRGELKPGPPALSEPAPPPPPPVKVTLRTKPVLLREVKVPYPSNARGLGIEGTVQVRVLVGADGAVHEARVVSGPGFGLDQAARAALLRFQFHPAMGSDGKPMAHWITYRYTFSIDD